MKNDLIKFLSKISFDLQDEIKQHNVSKTISETLIFIDFETKLFNDVMIFENRTIAEVFV